MVVGKSIIIVQTVSLCIACSKKGVSLYLLPMHTRTFLKTNVQDENVESN